MGNISQAIRNVGRDTKKTRNSGDDNPTHEQEHGSNRRKKCRPGDAVAVLSVAEGIGPKP